ncbi:MAG: DUF3679 domain-containing protein [Bacillaceae bacterium]
MKLFFIKSFLVGCLCFLCVLLGMQLANNGMQSVRGYEDETLAPVVQKKSAEENKTVVFGEEILQEKNFLSKTGEYVTSMTEKAVGTATKWSGVVVEKVKEMSR